MDNVLFLVNTTSVDFAKKLVEKADEYGMFDAVWSIVSCNFSCTDLGNLAKSPITRKRTLFFMKISSSSEESTSPISAATSSAGRFQFSVEKV